MEIEKRITSDYILKLAVFALLAFGYIMVVSSSAPIATEKLDDTWYFAFRQAGWILAGLFLMVTVSKMKPDFIEKYTYSYYFLVIGLLILVLIAGREVNGSKSWFGVGSMGIQPTEFAKIALILGLAKIIAKREGLMAEFRKGLVPSLVLSGIIIFLILMQPDFGSMLIVGSALVIMLFIGGVRLKQLLVLGAFAFSILSIYIVYLIANDSYKIDRYSAFVDPWADPKGAGYQIVQSFYAFANGGVQGVGVGESVQKLPEYLPMPYNDFIFPIIAEEIGLIGVTLFFILYLSFLGRSLFISLKSENVFFMLSGVGIVVMLSTQAIINIGGVTGSIPMTGVTLPFISYGGSSLLSTLICVGILLNISKQVKLQQQL